uniref:Fibroblast growth factor receptor substrate 3 n=1 Tax=Geotrypetes seraphini TaxID=260995 RepID=A0A6P8P2Q0_GEOSA|nr:fibroblast growth factor receptor substrate 3 [Geotrypetes seraphini]XP_033775220.1 fibroblast growth factor receptor substrate 3 [Geotrypetes seraphini]XP_033775221.1 fibroblast growth factor receptor substrate 3 [Geotrypetes seraphini]
MGSCCSCGESIPDQHPTKFKVTNVDDEGNELGSGLMELTQTELVLHTRKRDAVRWPYLCLRRYGYDSNLFSFESGRRCQTGQGIFAFKCSRAEEIFNLLQELMQCNSINVVEEPVILTRSSHHSELDIPRTPQTPNALGYTITGFPNGFHSFVREGGTYSTARPPSLGSLRHSSAGQEPVHSLITPEEQSHTYVNTTNMEEEMRSRRCMHSLPEATVHHGTPSCSLEDRNPQVFLQPGEVKFVLGPAPIYRRIPMQANSFCRHHQECGGHVCGLKREASHNNNNECKRDYHLPQYAYENINGLLPTSSHALKRGSSRVNISTNSCSHRRTALLHYENLPSLPPVWECQPLHSGEEEDEEEDEDMISPSLNGCRDDNPMQNYLNTESGMLHAGLQRGRAPSHSSCGPNVFSFDFQRPYSEPRQLNYIQVELEGKSDLKGQQNPRIPCTPTPINPVRQADSYAIIDLKKTAAMSSLQRALPRDDGTSRKTRHNSTDLPL